MITHGLIVSMPVRALERSLTIDVEGSGQVSALLMVPKDPQACFVLAHGAGAGMRHSFNRWRPYCAHPNKKLAALKRKAASQIADSVRVD